MADGLTVSDLEVPGRGGRMLLSVEALSLAPGQSLGLRGPSGAGKSTFLYAIAGLIEGARGRVEWNGTDILSLSPDRRGAFRAAHMGFIFQDFLLFDELSGIDNAALPALFAPRAQRPGIRLRAQEMLGRLGLSDPGRGVDSYSGGERQRVGVARALANDAAILLADEPTASLHRAAADALIEDLAGVARGQRTSVVVSHDPALLARMDRVITIADGRMTDGDLAA
ncbi:ABC transporter ATP-binding protein [Marinibacterium profundimaris]|uniref:ABC transporter ATP-binding protein n=1 Tax=Marinibacterium profundimaris TaxID=1679460 RepID=A0A225NHW4_9RHOB|nr:ATP-binding cassette domain-containing protein [Marinibacterium profundimaris]OWU70603.1 ABC transporter ATP-binding protein [Marinibacterium profundimaris]